MKWVMSHIWMGQCSAVHTIHMCDMTHMAHSYGWHDSYQWVMSHFSCPNGIMSCPNSTMSCQMLPFHVQKVLFHVQMLLWILANKGPDKRALQLVALLRKVSYKSRHPTGLHHPLRWIFSRWRTSIKRIHNTIHQFVPCVFFENGRFFKNGGVNYFVLHMCRELCTKFLILKYQQDQKRSNLVF